MSGKLSRDAYKKKMDLDAARKAGLAPAELDVDGTEINPHIPDYIKQAPWYMDTVNGAPTLQHQRTKRNNAIDDDSEVVLPSNRFAATKFRKGACSNCGAMTHKEKECLERPRKLGAKWSGRDLRPDELVTQNSLKDYDAKRDRWSGYNPSQHLQLMEEYALMEEARRQLKVPGRETATPTEAKDDSSQSDSDEDGSSSESDEDKYAESADMPGQKVDTKSRITVRNLRIREDTAKYLHNLDPDSAYYDPKTRSMRENPFSEKDPNEVDYAGDNFARSSKEDSKIAQIQLFAWEAAERGGNDLHLQATPSQAEFLFKEHQKKKSELKSLTNSALLDAYGGAEHLKRPRIAAQSDVYREYDIRGKLVNEVETMPKSKYEEDIFNGNHSSVWGSFWRDGKWGYACCKQHFKNAYCVKSQ